METPMENQMMCGEPGELLANLKHLAEPNAISSELLIKQKKGKNNMDDELLGSPNKNVCNETEKSQEITKEDGQLLMDNLMEKASSETIKHFELVEDDSIEEKVTSALIEHVKLNEEDEPLGKMEEEAMRVELNEDNEQIVNLSKKLSSETAMSLKKTEMKEVADNFEEKEASEAAKQTKLTKEDKLLCNLKIKGISKTSSLVEKEEFINNVEEMIIREITQYLERNEIETVKKELAKANAVPLKLNEDDESTENWEKKTASRDETAEPPELSELNKLICNLEKEMASKTAMPLDHTESSGESESFEDNELQDGRRGRRLSLRTLAQVVLMLQKRLAQRRMEASSEYIDVTNDIAYWRALALTRGEEINRFITIIEMQKRRIDTLEHDLGTLVSLAQETQKMLADISPEKADKEAELLSS